MSPRVLLLVTSLLPAVCRAAPIERPKAPGAGLPSLEGAASPLPPSLPAATVPAQAADAAIPPAPVVPTAPATPASAGAPAAAAAQPRAQAAAGPRGLAPRAQGKSTLGALSDEWASDSRHAGSPAAVAALFDGAKGRDLSLEYEAARAQAAAPGFAAGASGFEKLRGYRVLFVPGYMSSSLLKLAKATGSDTKPWHYFGPQIQWLSGLGVDHRIVETHTEQTNEHNGRVIAEAIRASDKPVILISHSKGGPDTLDALLSLSPSERAKVAGWMPVQSPFLGAPAADQIAANKGLLRLLGRLLEHPFIGGSRRGLTDMTTAASVAAYRARREEIARLLSEVPTIAFTSWRQLAATDLLQQTAHLGLTLGTLLHPKRWFSPVTSLAIVAKSAGMAMRALRMKTDGLVSPDRARLPGMDFVEARGVNHYVPFSDHGGDFDRLEFTQAVMRLLLPRLRR